MEIAREVGYYAVIPASVLLSQEISASAKLLYGVVSALARADGYCWASNERLAAILRCGERSVSRGIAELMKAGEIVEEIAPSKERKGNRERRLYTRESYARGVAKIGETANFGETGLAKNGETLNRIDNKSLINPPIPPAGVSTGKKPPKPATWKPERFEDFWAYYRLTFCAADHNRAGGRAEALQAWDKLKPDDALLRRIAAHLKAVMRTRQWADGYGIKYASTYLNAVRLGKISLDELPEANGEPQAASVSPGRRYMGTRVVDGREVDVYE